MRCIFCGTDSSDSKSVEHIIPESFGNSTAILRKGIVCDKCNNYFSRKIESPFLNSEAVSMLRQELELQNKRGKRITEFAYPKVGQEYVKQVSNNKYLIYTNHDKDEIELAASIQEYRAYLQKTDEILLKPNIYVSRLIAKMAAEAFVYKCGSSNGVCEYVLNDEIFKKIREYTRLGGREMWPYSARRIYSRNESYKGDPFSSVNWEFDFLFLENGEVYFIIVMHGIEYAINMIISNIEGYRNWLENNSNRSPLYISVEEREKNFLAYAESMFTKEEKEELDKLRKTNTFNIN